MFTQGITGDSLGKTARSGGWQMGAGCWQEASGPCHVDLSIRCLGILAPWRPASCNMSDLRARQEGGCDISYNLVLESPCHFSSVLLLHGSAL